MHKKFVMKEWHLKGPQPSDLAFHDFRNGRNLNLQTQMLR
ncbi:hypothetical protein LINPERPRIM_LOCUS15796 [Linum perenne]